MIIINATASKSSGALSIIKDFIFYISENTKYKFILFTCTKGIFTETNSLSIITLPIQNWVERIKWDSFGLEKWCIGNKIRPELVISFQNTCTHFKSSYYKSIPQLVYYHQALPLIKYKWNLINKEEVTLFLYSKFYGLFVNKNNKNANYVVQLPYIKERFIKKFKNINKDKVYVLRPNIVNCFPSCNGEESDEIKFIYPATHLRYKNHKIIVKAMKKIIQTEANINFEILFTVAQDSNIANYIKKENMNNVIKCIGVLPFSKLQNLYKKNVVLLFPSKIESYGLPLIEAAVYGIPIIAADLPYAREVLENYDNKYFANPDNVDEWMQKIEKVVTMKYIRKPLKVNKHNTWEDFMLLAENLIDKRGL